MLNSTTTNPLNKTATGFGSMGTTAKTEVTNSAPMAVFSLSKEVSIVVQYNGQIFQIQKSLQTTQIKSINVEQKILSACMKGGIIMLGTTKGLYQLDISGETAKLIKAINYDNLVLKILEYEQFFVASIFDLSPSKHIKYLNSQNDQPILYSIILYDPAKQCVVDEIVDLPCCGQFDFLDDKLLVPTIGTNLKLQTYSINQKFNFESSEIFQIQPAAISLFTAKFIGFETNYLFYYTGTGIQAASRLNCYQKVDGGTLLGFQNGQVVFIDSECQESYLVWTAKKEICSFGLNQNQIYIGLGSLLNLDAPGEIITTELSHTAASFGMNQQGPKIYKLAGLQ